MADPSVTERYYPFSEGPGEYVTEDDWAAMTEGFQDNGVYGHPGTPDLTIEPGPLSNTIQVNIGDAQVSGYHYRLTAPKQLDTIANAGTTDRWDTVVLQLDKITKTITPVLLAGTNIWEIGEDRCPIGLWKQPPSTAVTADYWGAATDARWFIGNRIRPYLESAIPPAKPGSLIYDASADGAGTVYLGKLDANGTPYWAPWYPIASERVDTAEVENLYDQTTRSTSYTAGPSWTMTTFEAPPSGKVMVTVFAQLEAEAPGSAYCSFEIRLGTDASGPVVFSPSDTIAAGQQESRWSASSRRKLVDGLTPGSTYFIRTMHRTSNASCTATVFHRALLVEPVYTDVAPGAPDNGAVIVPSDVVVTKGGSTIRIPDGDTATQALNIKLPAGDRATAPDTFAVYYNAGTDAQPDWQRTGYFNEYGELRVIPSATTRVPVRIRLLNGQSADALQVADLNNVPMAGFTANGSLFAPNFTPVLVLGPTDPIPAGTANGTLIFRK